MRKEGNGGDYVEERTALKGGAFDAAGCSGPYRRETRSSGSPKTEKG